MQRAALAAVLALALGMPSLYAQNAPADAEVQKGIREVEEGDYDSAILTLDNAARRLAKDPARIGELAQAYVHLGLAYVAKGREAAARAQFREALLRARDLTLSPDKFPPKVVDLFEATREDLRREAGPAAPSETAATKKKGRGVPILLGVGAAAAAGVALAASGGGSAGEGTGASGGTSGGTTTDVSTGVLTQANASAQVTIGPAASAGPWSAQLSWTGSGGDMIHWFVVDAASGDGVGDARLLTPNSGVLDWTGRAGVRYRVDIFLQESGPPSTNFELRVTRPR